MSLPRGLITQSFAILGVSVIAAGIHWGLKPLWVDPFEGFRPAGTGNARSTGPRLPVPSDDPVMGDPVQSDQLTEPDPQTETPAIEQPQEQIADSALPTNLKTRQSFALYAANQADFLDARAYDTFQAGHIAGAYSVPYNRAANRVAALMADGFIDPSRRVVVYCIGGTCDESKFVIRALLEAGFDPDMLHIDDDGYPAWTAAGHPTGTGPDITQELP